MANFLERSVLMTIGVAAAMREVADALTDELVERGAATTEEGRAAFDEAVDKAKGEARSLRGRFDSQLKRGYRDMGIATSERLDDMQLKIAQLEHRLALLEAALEAATGEGGLAPAAGEATTG